MLSVKELVKAKNMDLLVHSYNQRAKRINEEGFVDKNSKEVKDLKNKYDALIARFDTDKNTNKKLDKEYNYGIKLDSTEIIGIRGIKPNIKVKS